MKLKPKSKLIIVISFIPLLSIIFYGLLINSMTVHYSPGGVEYNVDSSFQIPLDANDRNHTDNFSKANYSIAITFEKGSQYIWHYQVLRLFSNNSIIDIRLPQSDYIPSQHSKCPTNKWCDFSIKFNINSTDSYIMNKTYFGDSNTIKGKIRINQIENIIITRYTGFEIKLAKNYSNIYLYKDSYRVEIRCSEKVSLTFGIRIDVLMS